MSHSVVCCLLRKIETLKLRVFMLSIPLPKIPPIVIAAVARGSKDDAAELFKIHQQVTEMLDEEEMFPISYSSDGTEVERSLQRLIIDSADSIKPWSVESTIEGCSISLPIPLRKGHPFTTPQDSNHAKKTGRNQLFTGARILTLGSFPTFFSQLRNLASHELGPLFLRDVEKVDKQDDRAAARAFSANSLDFNMKEYPEQRALSVYLFTLGELYDAWQNRRISHHQRVKMVLRARYFLMAWRTHILSHPNYSTETQFISRESYDIFVNICDSLLRLIVIHRQYFPMYPLLPWLHSTEVCEHLFGLLRQLKKDFSYIDVLELEPKLRTLLLGAFADLSPEEQANQTASGYHHTYFKADDLDTAMLMIWPQDQEIFALADDAFREAEELLKTLGINAGRMLASHKEHDPSKKATSKHQRATTLPQPRTLHEILEMYSGVTKFPTSKQADSFENCQLALSANSVEESLAM